MKEKTVEMFFINITTFECYNFNYKYETSGIFQSFLDIFSDTITISTVIHSNKKWNFENNSNDTYAIIYYNPCVGYEGFVLRNNFCDILFEDTYDDEQDFHNAKYFVVVNKLNKSAQAIWFSDLKNI